MKGLTGLLGSEDKKSSESGTSVEDEHLDDAFDAMGKDRKAFRAAMKAAMKACLASHEAGTYGEDDDEEE